jgi:hypothetical protein
MCFEKISNQLMLKAIQKIISLKIESNQTKVLINNINDYLILTLFKFTQK